MQKIKYCMLIAMMAVACFVGIELGIAIKHVGDAAAETRDLVLATNKKLDGTFRNLNAILIQVGLVASRVEDASRDLRTVAQAQNKYWSDISKSTATLMEKANITLDNVNVIATSLNTFIDNTDNQVNNKLLPDVELVVLQSKESLTGMTDSVRMVSLDSKKVMDDLHVILADPNWQRSIRNMSDTSSSISEAATQLPSVARSMEKIAKTSSKWQKIQIPISILSLVWRTFF